MNKPNHSKELDALIEKNTSENKKPSLMLHVCCAVCASYVLEYLYEHFHIKICYYNPNITEEREYSYRYSELKRYIRERNMTEVEFIGVEYDPERFFSLVKGREEDREGGARCSVCFFDRLSYTAEKCKEYGCDYFATTLTISPLKNAEVINAIGMQIGEKTGANYLCTDFKKKNGYKRSIELSKEYNLYRQNYCGCVFSRNQASTRNS